MARISRRTFVASSLASIGSSRLALAQGKGADRVTLGIVNTISDAPFFIADAKGYFRDVGLDVDIADFPSGAKMIASLGTGQLDVSGGAVSAGLYNAAERGIPVRIVADKARNALKYGFESILVRQDLMDTGRFADFKDLKGLKVAIPAIGSAGEQSILNEAMKRGGLAFTDCERVYLSTGDQFAGLQNKAIDVAIVSEPTVSLAEKRGIARRFTTVDTFYPDQQAAVVTFGSEFIAKRRDVGVRFMIAFIRGARDMNDAQYDGHFAGPKGDEVMAIIAKYSRVKDIDLLKTMVPSACDPDGRPNLASLEKDLAFVQGLGLVGSSIKAAQIVDLSYVDAALAELGPYKRAG
ncbi:MAG: transporter substrate-binding protein [Hyphomicrobiales bacterium]|nr:transporter substrate-binding protein [Hyphomicrobiales bacterium]